MTESDPYANKRTNRVTSNNHPSLVRARSTIGIALVVDMGSRPQLRLHHRVIDHHPRDGLPIFFLFGRVQSMSPQIDSERVHRVLHTKILKLSVVVRVIPVENSDSAAITRDVDTLQTVIELDNVGTT